jgi:beta-galactosidase
VRSPFEWRVDGGAWKKSSPDDLTTDLMPRAEWTEVAWLKLGERDTDEVRDNKKFEMARYIVHYADGQSVTIPVYSELDIENYRQENPRAIPGAQTAWVSKFPDSGESAVAYSKQWNNPRAEVTIKSIDFTYSADKRGVPVLLVITAATSGK